MKPFYDTIKSTESVESDPIAVMNITGPRPSLQKLLHRSLYTGPEFQQL